MRTFELLRAQVKAQELVSHGLYVWAVVASSEVGAMLGKTCTWLNKQSRRVVLRTLSSTIRHTYARPTLTSNVHHSILPAVPAEAPDDRDSSLGNG